MLLPYPKESFLKFKEQEKLSNSHPLLENQHLIYA